MTATTRYWKFGPIEYCRVGLVSILTIGKWNCIRVGDASRIGRSE